LADGNDSARIDALETRIAYQDRTIEELNAALTEQWKLIDQLTKRLTQMEEQVRSGSYIADPSSEKPPPHY
jgi:SlyX protein